MPTHKEFLKQYAEKMGCSEKNAQKYLEGFTDLVLDSMKKGESATIQNLGRFYVRERSDSTVFKFTASQKLKAILGWSSTYKGDI